MFIPLTDLSIELNNALSDLDARLSKLEMNAIAPMADVPTSSSEVVASEPAPQ